MDYIYRTLHSPGTGIVLLGGLAVIVTAFPVSDTFLRAFVVLIAFVIMYWELRCIGKDRDERDQRHTQIVEMLRVDTALVNAKERMNVFMPTGLAGVAHMLSYEILDFLSQRQHDRFPNTWWAQDAQTFAAYLKETEEEWNNRFVAKVREFGNKLTAQGKGDPKLDKMANSYINPAIMRMIAERLGAWSTRSDIK